MNWPTSSLTGNLLDDTRENSIPYKYESGPRPDCTIKLFTDNIVFDALRWWIEQHRHWRVTCLMIPERTLYRTNTNHDRDQIVRTKFRIDKIVSNALRWWIKTHHDWRVTCLMGPDRMLYRTNANYDRDNIVRYSFVLITSFSMRYGDEFKHIVIDGQPAWGYLREPCAVQIRISTETRLYEQSFVLILLLSTRCSDELTSIVIDG